MPPRELGRKSLVLFASTWSTTLLGMFISILIARGLGPAVLGSLAFTLGLVGLVMAALLPGFGQAHLKRLAEGQDAGRCVGTMLAIQLALTLALLAVLAAASRAWRPADSPELAVVFLWMLAAQLAGTFADAALRVFVAREWVVPHALILLGGRAVRLVATIAILLWIPRVTWVAATFALEGALNGAVATALLAGRYDIRPRRPTRESLAGYWRYARPFVVTTPLALVQDSVDRYLVGRWAGLAAAGYYHVARALWETLASVLAPPGTFLLTRLSALYARRSETGDLEARAFFSGAVDKMFFVTTPLALLFWAFAEPAVVLLYGSSFAPAATALRVLVLATVAMAVVNPYTYVLYALELADRLVPVNLVRIAVYLALLWLLVPARPAIHGIVGPWPGDAGAAAARLVLVLFPAWIYWRWTREEAGLPFHRRTTVYLVGFGVAVLSHHALLALGAPLAGRSILATGAAAAALAVYLLFLMATHPGTRDNLRYAGSLLSPQRFGAFLREGLGRR